MLPKKHRLKKDNEFQQIFKKGRRYRSPYFLLIIRKDSNAEKPQLGLITSKKIGNAVQRHRARRILGEAIRLEFPNLKPGFKAIAIAFKSILEVKTPEVQRYMKRLFTNAQLYRR